MIVLAVTVSGITSGGGLRAGRGVIVLTLDSLIIMPVMPVIVIKPKGFSWHPIVFIAVLLAACFIDLLTSGMAEKTSAFE